MNFLRRNSQKQYDGPATTAPVNYEPWPADDTYANYRHNQQATAHRYSNVRQQANHPKWQPSSSSNQRRKSTTTRKKDTADHRNAPLASGISSRRTTQRVSNHLPAHLMSSPEFEARKQADGSMMNVGNLNGRCSGIPTSVGIPSSVNISHGSETSSSIDSQKFGSGATSSASAAQRRERKPQMPMEHDGGVLCLCAIPTDNSHDTAASSSNNREEGKVHRFLSGGADGTIKLWEVHDPASSPTSQSTSPNNEQDAKLIPRLIRTYRGHTGYVHSIAILGTIDVETISRRNSSEHNPSSGNFMISRRNSSEHSTKFSRRNSSEHSAAGFMMGRRRSSLMSRGSLTLDEDEVHSQSSSNASKTLDEPSPKVGTMRHSKMGRRFSGLSMDSGGSSDRLLKQYGSHGAQQHQQQRKQMLFVSASRDNTLRIWPIVDNEGDNNHNNTLPLLDESERSGKSSDDSAVRGVKLRGHAFGTNKKDGSVAVGGVLCVCAVPSLDADNSVDEDDGSRSSYDNSNNYSGSNNNNRNCNNHNLEGTQSAGQFCSGGSDGNIRVWDVRSALNLKKIPKHGMYATVQLQTITPELGQNGKPAPITSLVCTHNGTNHRGTQTNESHQQVSLFAGDASGLIRRYSRMNTSGDGHVNSAIWWGCTGIFAGHTHPITSLVMLSSSRLMPLLCPNFDVEDRDVGTMLVSSCDDGFVRVWDAFDVRKQNLPLESSELSHDEYMSSKGLTPRRKAMWEIELNDGNDLTTGVNAAEESKNSGCPLSVSQSDRTYNSRIGVTSLTTIQSGTLMAAGTTDGAIRMWNVSSGLYEGAYNLKSVQIWSLDVLSEQRDGQEGEHDGGYCDERKKSVGIIVSGDNRGRIRVLRNVSARKT